VARTGTVTEVIHAYREMSSSMLVATRQGEDKFEDEQGVGRLFPPNLESPEAFCR
jgi:hypothetical protein